jgi:hypothetical protein
LAANPLPGHALCFAGVGFDDLDLAIYEFMPKVKRLVVEAEIKARDEARGFIYKSANSPVDKGSQPNENSGNAATADEDQNNGTWGSSNREDK